MNRSIASRLTALLAAALFFLAWGGEAVGMHPCAHHTAISQAGAEHAHHHGAPETPEEPAHGGCTCVSGCPSMAGSLLPPLQAGVRLHALVERIAPRQFPPAQSSAPHLVPFFLPYSQGPPLG